MIRPHLRGILRKDRRMRICISTAATFLCLFALINYVGSTRVQANVNASNLLAQSLHCCQATSPEIIKPEPNQKFLVGQTVSLVFTVNANVDSGGDNSSSQIQTAFTFPEGALTHVRAQEPHECAQDLPAQFQFCSKPVSFSDLADMEFTFTGELTHKAVPSVTLTAWDFWVAGGDLRLEGPLKKNDVTIRAQVPPPPPPPPPAVPSVKVAVPPHVVSHVVAPPPPPAPPAVPPVKVAAPPRPVVPPAVPPVPPTPRPGVPALPKTGSDPNAPPVP